MSERVVGRVREAGAAFIEYVMLLGFITALVLFLLRLLYPSSATNFETLINQWGDKIAREIAGDKITEDSDAWGED
jgi:Flp pilus assembly pilin Flp